MRQPPHTVGIILGRLPLNYSALLKSYSLEGASVRSSSNPRVTILIASHGWFRTAKKLIMDELERMYLATLFCRIYLLLLLFEVVDRYGYGGLVFSKL